MIAKRLPPLREGERLDQPTFHARYEAMPPGTWAELIGGVVYIWKRVKASHGHASAQMAWWLGEYEAATPGTDGMIRVSTILGKYSEVHPDACLLITAPGMGQTGDQDGYVVGGPEFVGEITNSAQPIELTTKKDDYQSAGVKEYVVVRLEDPQVFWFVLESGTFKRVFADRDGIHRSRVFPGLWLDAAAFLNQDLKQLKAVLQQGLATPEHANFVKRLAGK